MPECPELKRALERYETLRLACEMARRSAEEDPKDFASRLGWELTGRKGYTDELDFFKKLFDELGDKLYEMCLVDVAAELESHVFKKLPNAVGNIRSFLEKEYTKTKTPLSRAASKFVLSDKDVRNLSGARELLASNLPQSLMNNLDYLVQQRDRVSHGKRFGGEPKKRHDLTVIVADLEEILRKHNLLSS
jgi:hypothetical protein